MKERSKRVEGGREKVGGREALNCLGKQLQDRERLCIPRSILISCFDFHKMSIMLNHLGPPLLASYA